MAQRIMLTLASFIILVICMRIFIPIVIDKEMRRQQFACANMQKLGYEVVCE